MDFNGTIQRQSLPERILFPIVLLLWPLAACRQGVSVMDTTYSLANFRYPDSIGTMWRFATFLANMTGSFLIRLPFGKTMLGMNILCLLFISVTALLSYFVLKRHLPAREVFLGEVIAVSFCWCPAVILYNYLTYLLFTVCVLLLYEGVSAYPKRQGLFFAAGVLLGLNVLVRFSNLAECALILALWFWCYLEKTGPAEGAKLTGLCIGGFAAGFFIAYGLSAILYGPAAFFEMIPLLFGSTQSVASYTFSGMILSVLSAYLHSLRWILLAAVCTLAGCVFFRLPILKERAVIKKILYVLGIAVLFRFYYGRGMFHLNYQDYGSMFEWGMAVVILAAALAAAGAAGAFGFPAGERFLAFAVLLMIVILPLGSNNYTYPVLNCLFIAAPYALAVFSGLLGKTKGKDIHFPWKSMILAFLVMAFLQSGIFHVRFAFRDGTDGTKRSERVEESAVFGSMYTTPENASSLRDLLAFLEKEGLAGTPSIVMGNAPGIHYLMELPPAIDTAWPDLDSYPAESLSRQLKRQAGLHTEKGIPLPLVVIHKEEKAQSESAEEKQKILGDYLAGNPYSVIYDNNGYTVWSAGKEY